MGWSARGGARRFIEGVVKTLKVWDLETGKVVAAFTAGASLDCCAVGPDGRLIVAGDASSQVHFLTLEE